MGNVIVGFWVLCAIFGKAVVPQDPFASSPLNGLEAPSADYWFGTDRLGRDVFSRVIVGSRDIMLIAPVATLLGTVLGTALGLVTGYFRGAVDDILSRLIETVLALPVILVAVLAITSLGPSNITIILVVGFGSTRHRDVPRCSASASPTRRVAAQRALILFADTCPT